MSRFDGTFGELGSATSCAEATAYRCWDVPAHAATTLRVAACVSVPADVAATATATAATPAAAASDVVAVLAAAPLAQRHLLELVSPRCWKP